MNVSLNKELTLESPALNPDGAGGWVQTWVVQGTLWTQVIAASAREKATNLATRSTAFNLDGNTAHHDVNAAPCGHTYLSLWF